MIKKKVVIVDFGLGNLYSVKHACVKTGMENTIISDRKEDLFNADALLLPGVGAFGDAMENLRKRDLISPIKDFISSGKPFFGICLGMQLLFSESEEFGRHKGLDVIPGHIKKFPPVNAQKKRIRVPQIAWNKIFQAPQMTWQGTPLQYIREGEYMYFVHSFYPVPAHPAHVLSITGYEGINYASAIRIHNIFATQFHPEKSGKEGVKIYSNWAKMVNEIASAMTNANKN